MSAKPKVGRRGANYKIKTSAVFAKSNLGVSLLKNLAPISFLEAACSTKYCVIWFRKK